MGQPSDGLSFECGAPEPLRAVLQRRYQDLLCFVGVSPEFLHGRRPAQPPPELPRNGLPGRARKGP
eukprot:14070237-Alexandrium_andersonii.AAC.1